MMRGTHRCRREGRRAIADSGQRVRDVPAKLSEVQPSLDRQENASSHHDRLGTLPRLGKMELGSDTLAMPSREDARNELLGRVGGREDAVVVEVCVTVTGQQTSKVENRSGTDRRRAGCSTLRRLGASRQRCSRSRRSRGRACGWEQVSFASKRRHGELSYRFLTPCESSL